MGVSTNTPTFNTIYEQHRGLSMEECIPCEFVKGSLYRHQRGLCVVMVESLPRAPMNNVIYGHYKSLGKLMKAINCTTTTTYGP